MSVLQCVDGQTDWRAGSVRLLEGRVSVVQTGTPDMHVIRNVPFE